MSDPCGKTDITTIIDPIKNIIPTDLFLLGATVGLGLQEIYELGLLGDCPLHFHLLMRVHGLQVELSEHHYCHEFLLKYFTSHREGDRGTEKVGGCTGCCGVKQSVGDMCLLVSFTIKTK